jgi:TatD DNase family protein
MLQYIDTHTHLYDDAFQEDIDEVVKRAKEAGISSCILPAIDMENHDRLVALCEKYPGCMFPCTGLHPTSVKQNWKEELSFVHDRIAEGRYFAIGEIGMDGYWSRDYIKEQEEVFVSQLKLAYKLDLPVIIHSRDATGEIFKALAGIKGIGIRGVFHAFSGSYETFSRLSDYGEFLIGIGGVITYKNANLRDTLKKIPLENLILETDSPWLTPVPYRGTRNEPSYLTQIAASVAEAKGCELEEVAEITTNNAKKLFRI